MSDQKPPKNPWDDNDQEDERDPYQKTSKEQTQRAKPSSSGNGNVVDDMIDQLQDKLNELMGASKGKSSGRSKKSKSSGRGNGRGVRPMLLLLAVLALFGFWLSSGFFRVQEGEAGVLMRFGRMVHIVGPGLRYHWPSPIENVIIRKVSAVNRIDGGLSLNSSATDSSREAEQALTLTSDENMVIIGYSVQWRMKDVGEYLFTAREPENLIIIAAESAIREVVGQTPARMALTEGRESISNRAHDLLQKILDSYKIGVEISSFQLQRVEAPPQVIESFNDVQASLVDADRLKNEAEAYRNQIVPVARGQAEQILQEATAFSKKHIAEAEGEAARFASVLKAYNNSKDVTLTRYHMDTMTRVLKNSSTIILDPHVGNMVPYLPIHELKGAKKKNAQTGSDSDVGTSSSYPSSPVPSAPSPSTSSARDILSGEAS